MTESTAQKWLLYEPTKTHFSRIFPELAVEIGLNESIVLMQISYWISISNNERDGKFWTYQTLQDMHDKAFPFWGRETIRRTLIHLQEMGYILIGKFNERTGDKTQWFALEPDKCSSLKSVLCTTSEGERVSKRDTITQNETDLSQNETTLPEITTDRTQNKESLAPKVAKVDKAIVKYDPYKVTDAAVEETKAARKGKGRNTTSIPADVINPFKDEMVNLFKWAWATMTRIEKGQIQNAAKQLIEVGLTVSDLVSLYRYCAKRFTTFSPMALVKHVSDWRNECGPKTPTEHTSALASYTPRDPNEYIGVQNNG